MTKKELRTILKGLDNVMKRRDVVEKAWKAWTDSLTDTYQPIFTDSIVQYYIDGASRGDKEVQEYLESYAWEVSGMDKAICRDRNGKEYNVKNKSEFIDWMLA